MEREKDEVVQRKTQLEQVRKLYHAAKRDYAGTDEKLAMSSFTSLFAFFLFPTGLFG